MCYKLGFWPKFAKILGYLSHRGKIQPQLRVIGDDW